MSFLSIEIPYRSDSGAYFAAIRALPWPAWLDSGGMGRFDILTAAPVRTLVHEAAMPGDPYDRLRAELGELAPSIDGIPFAGGALGYWGYDLARSTMALPEMARDEDRIPPMAVGMYDWALVLDHAEQRAQLVSHLRHPGTDALLDEVQQRLQATPQPGLGEFSVHGRISSNFTRERYRAAFEAVQGYLRAGDCYQVNLAQRFSAEAEGDALTAYLDLRNRSPAPYSAFLDFSGVKILCASPERFLTLRGDRVETKPIKGTRPRDADAARDRQLAEELRCSLKDHAENLMIVDLLRNDLGKSCVAGSVRVPKLFDVESYANVHHLVSTVEGRLAEGKDAPGLLRDCFPGGSITGAPKRRAMEIIEQLEPDRRGVYCGSIGYVGYDGNMDTNIAIRTLVHAGGMLRCWAGGGIVADSQCDAEYQETLDKASAMLALMRRFGGEDLQG